MGTRNSSAAQAPRSISLQRVLQKGRAAFVGANRLGPPQVGHLTVGWVDSLMLCSLTQALAYAQSVSSKAAFSVVDCRLPVSLGRTNRTDTIKRLALISGIRPDSESMRKRSS